MDDLDSKTSLADLDDGELGALVRASPLYPILIEFEKEEKAAIGANQVAARSVQHETIIHETI